MTPAPVQFTSFSAVQERPVGAGEWVLADHDDRPVCDYAGPGQYGQRYPQFHLHQHRHGCPRNQRLQLQHAHVQRRFLGYAHRLHHALPVNARRLGTNSLGKVINALDSSVGWNYQTFGYWLVNLSTLPVAGAMSFGSPTPVSGIPITSNATYAGRSGGVYVDPTGNVFTYRGSMLSSVDFAARTIGFSVNPTRITPVLDRSIAATCWRARGDRQH